MDRHAIDDGASDAQGAGMRRRGRGSRWSAWGLCAFTLTLTAVAGWFQSRGVDPEPQPDEPLVATHLWTFAGVAASVLGGLVASRLPRNPYGWLWSVFGLAMCLSGTGPILAAAMGAPRWAGTLLGSYGFLGFVGSTVLVILLFPTGRAPGPRSAWIGRAAMVTTAVTAVLFPFAFVSDDERTVNQSPLAVDGSLGRALTGLAVAGVVVLFVLCLAAAVAALLRFRGAGAIERQQLKFFVVAAAANASFIFADLTGLDDAVGPPWVWAVLGAAAFVLLPVAVGFAVLRYRLYEIDRIISRTVSYTLLTLALVAFYVVAVTALRRVLSPVTGTSELAVAGSTLLVAAAFQPARKRLQVVVDRRFNRTRYDAARTLEEYAERVRHEVDVDHVSSGLRRSVATSLEPSFVAVWLRPSDPSPDVPVVSRGDPRGSLVVGSKEGRHA